MAVSVQYWKYYVGDNTKLSRKSENAVTSNHVLRFLFDTELQFITAQVQASMGDRCYKVQVQLGTDGTVISSQCQCALQCYKCHHVASALLFGYKNASKTDVKCSWIKHPKSAQPKTTQTVTDLFPSPRPEYRALSRPVTDVDRQSLYSDLAKLGRFTGLHWILSPEPKVDQQLVVPVVEDLLQDPQFTSSTAPLTWLRTAMIVNRQQIFSTATATIGQRENPNWATVRKLRFTASNFGDLLTAAKHNRLSVSLMKKLLSSYNLETVAAIQWGVTHESTALQQYCRLGAEVKTTGIWLHESGVLAASPDGIVVRAPGVLAHGCDGLAVSTPYLLEIKCPYAHRHSTVVDAAADKDFFLGTTNGSLYLKASHRYYHQIQGQLHITGYSDCDLVVWTEVDVQAIRVTKDITWTQNIAKLIDLYFNSFIPCVTK